MKIFQWLAKLNPLRAKTAPASAGLRCCCCLHHIHKGERFVIEAARHRDCRDPKLTGQGRLFDPVPKMINGEQVNVAPAASMGTELLECQSSSYEEPGAAAPSSWPNFPPVKEIDDGAGDQNLSDER